MTSIPFPLRLAQEVLFHLLFAGVLAFGTYHCDITIFGAGVVWLLGAVTIHCVFQLLEAVKEDTSPAFERTSGLGGNMGGWRVSRVLMLFVLTLSFGFFTTIFAVNAYNNPNKNNSRCEQQKKEQAPPAKDKSTPAKDTTKLKTVKPPPDSAANQ